MMGMRDGIRAACLAVVGAALLAASGCAGVREFVQDHELAARLAVQQTVQRYCLRGDNPAGRCARVVEVFDRAEGALSDPGRTVTVGLLDQEIRAAIRWNRLTLPDRNLVETLLQAAREDAEARYGDGVLAPEDRVAVVEVFGWIRDGARAVR